MTFVAGEVWLWYSHIANKDKLHLCVSAEGLFLLLNTPKQKRYKADLTVPCATFPFLKPTECGESTVSCSTLVRETPAYVASRRGRMLGTASGAFLRQLHAHLKGSDGLIDEEKDLVVEELYNHLGI